MFEKDVLQLIRGLRAHKGNEREYIQASLRECRKEIRSQDMDAKATALMKLVYLEMFGHDMSWASFNVLEVMSSQKYLQKRVGYLAAVQSFRPDTEVLMLAENLLKKDLGNTEKNVIQLPLGAIPHVINPSMANSLLGDLLPRLSHSNPTIRKKTIVTLYRLAVVYPETLRPAWPKIKERLLDENEDPSVTSAIVNVVCELSWRRPRDFLPLAPRLFELLTQSGNNWMAIKIIKLFSTLTPLEPRLVKKLLPPLTNIIKTTPAMSLLYECINGIIQGGIMEAATGSTEGDDIARLCVSKLRAMLVVQGDPNLRYVALLAFAKITASHADIVAQHQDVIMECIDDADISIRTRALDLVVGMVNAVNLQPVVERLLKQLRNAGVASEVDDTENDRGAHQGVILMAEEDESEAQASIRKKKAGNTGPPPLPEDYRASVIERILDMCSQDTYANMTDFEWYINVLVGLVGQCPSTTPNGHFGSQSSNKDNKDIADAIGAELLNVAVRVKAVRPEAAAAAQSLLLLNWKDETSNIRAQGVLKAAAFIAGEYASHLQDLEATLSSILYSSNTHLHSVTLCSYIQAAPKIFAAITSNISVSWTESRLSYTDLLISRMNHFLEPLTLHPDLEVQERAVEYLDLMRLASEAVLAQPTSDDDSYAEPPLLLTQALPSLFSGMDLNPVAPAALSKVPSPQVLDLDTPINSSLSLILQQADFDTDPLDTGSEVRKFYYERPSAVATEYNRPVAAVDLLQSAEAGSRNTSYQGDAGLDGEALERKRAERRERYKDDPYYIDSDRGASGTSTPMHSILRGANGEDVDVDSIPVMELKLESGREGSDSDRMRRVNREPKARKPRRHFEIAGDETLDGDESTPASYSSSPNKLGLASASAIMAGRGKRSLLEVDSSGLSAFSLESGSASTGGPGDAEARLKEEEEMARAIREVERMRLEMQRRDEAIPEPDEGTVVKPKKVRRKVKTTEKEGEAGADGVAKKKKKKKVKAADAEEEEITAKLDAEVEGLAKSGKKKKKRQVVFDEDG